MLDSVLEEYDQFDDYLEMVMQFGVSEKLYPHALVFRKRGGRGICYLQGKTRMSIAVDVFWENARKQSNFTENYTLSI